ncbi:hypothetical protein B0H14DRAFT_2701072 [Mycena olivaceomarginata]|nr:hypothetical protein B0H14DRAFT_3002772 [Mycena olivaceomarginata]KAJ7737661.1 hypothetical protein B0H14DRAFT_2992859 [Mycena olivaceomarginata]KAJ7884214.1 hypothetical protein B0H14DRAFT_2701072 [Mycena olivaceomarginata]
MLAFPALALTLPSSVLLLTTCVAFSVVRSNFLRPYFKFIWHCLLRPIGAVGWKPRLAKFYDSQATSEGFLRGHLNRVSTLPSSVAPTIREQPIHKEFRTFIYLSHGQEDPSEDMKHLELSPDDSMFVITSAGDNALHYAALSRPQRIHCVDMNPCQGHLLELKLAAIQCLEYDDFFALFGKGRHANFRGLLDSKLAPHLSSGAYQFWRTNVNSFSSSSTCADIQALCIADTLEQQEEIWRKKLRPVLLNPLVATLLKNPVFVGMRYVLKTSNYFYILALLGHYTPESCPEYLTRAGFDALKARTVCVLRGLSDRSLTRAVIMDHLDWFTPGSPDTDEEVAELYRALTPGGFVLWRSAARKPWYNANFERQGFQVTALGVRQGEGGPALDRVNMYASFWRAILAIPGRPNSGKNR